MEFFIELFLELLLQLFLEAGVAVVDGRLGLSSRIVRHIFKAIFYLICSFNLGAFSVAFFSTPFLAVTPNPWISLLVVQVTVAILIVHFSRWLGRTKSWDLELEKFAFSLILAFGFALTRYLCMTWG